MTTDMSAVRSLAARLYDVRREFLTKDAEQPALVIAGHFTGRRGNVAAWKRDLDADYCHLVIGNGELIRVRAEDVRVGDGSPRL